MTKTSDSCVEPARGPIDAPVDDASLPSRSEVYKENATMIARVGKKAPDFETSAYLGGGFKNIRLSDYIGQWVMLCFYPGDFTFV